MRRTRRHEVRMFSFAARGFQARDCGTLISSMDLSRLPETDPTEIYRYRDGLYAVDLLTAALTEFDFFTWLNAHPASKSRICDALKITERPTDVMLTLFAAIGFIRSIGG